MAFLDFLYISVIPKELVLKLFGNCEKILNKSNSQTNIMLWLHILFHWTSSSFLLVVKAIFTKSFELSKYDEFTSSFVKYDLSL